MKKIGRERRRIWDMEEERNEMDGWEYGAVRYVIQVFS